METSTKMENGFPTEETDTFDYSEDQYNYEGSSWHNPQKTKFEKLLCSKWDQAMSAGKFQYDLSHMESRRLDGEYGFILQKNEKRAKFRRTPHAMTELNMAFDPNAFNFTKVKNEEILFYINPHKQDNKQRKDHLVVINISPLEYGHILLVPDAHQCYNQVLTSQTIRMGIELMLLSSSPSFRVAYNSLCGLASVNHLHIHAWYVEHPLFIEQVKCEEIGQDIYEMDVSFTKGFVFQMNGTTVELLTKGIHAITQYFTEHEIAHNLVMTRGGLLNKDNNSQIQTIRVFLWPRRSIFGSKDLPGVGTTEVKEQRTFNIAAAELGGHVPMYIPDFFDKLTEDEIKKTIAKESLLEEDRYKQIKADCVKLMNDLKA